MAKIVHFEIPVDDPERASQFYRRSLGWEISAFDGEPYWLAVAGPAEEPGANGALTARDDLHSTPVIVAGVEDLDRALESVSDAGGEIIQGKMAIPGVGWSAYAHDSEGNVMGLFQPGPARP